MLTFHNFFRTNLIRSSVARANGMLCEQFNHLIKKMATVTHVGVGERSIHCVVLAWSSGPFAMTYVRVYECAPMAQALFKRTRREHA